jgi:DNA-binding FadR family transcriptional regulator
MPALRPTSLAERQVYAPRLADVVADRIREMIITGELSEGERLPRLDDLLGQFGVSAPSMREALRILESEGLIAVQRGSVGGAMVRRPSHATAAYTLALVLRSEGTEVGDVVEALTMLEPLCAMLCARRSDRNKTVVRELRKINATSRKLVEGDEMAFTDAMTAFHTALVNLCGNKTLALVAGTLESIWLADVKTWVQSSTAHGTYPNREKLAAVEVHEQAIELIKAGDGPGVHRLMTKHINMKRIYEDTGADPTQLVNPKNCRVGN